MNLDNLKTFFKSKAFLLNLRYAVIGIVAFLLLVSIFLRIYTLHGRSLDVPDFTGLTAVQAADLADEKHLNVEIIDSVYDQTVPPGTVVEQSPKPGSKVKKHRNIFLYINAIKPKMIQMPDLVGITLRVATSTLQIAGLEVGSISYVPDIAQNTIIFQKYHGHDIAKGEAIPLGSRVDLILGQGSNGQSITIPDLQGISLREARKLLIESYLNVGKISFDNTIKSPADSSKSFVFKQNPQEGSASPGSSVDIWLTTDQKKAKEKTKGTEAESNEDESIYE